MGKSGYTAETERVVAAVCAAYVVASRRERLTAKPDDLFEKLCHNPEIFDPRYAVPIPRGTSTRTVALALRGGESLDVAFYLGGWSGYEVGATTLENAVEMADQTGGALAALPDARRVFYKSEDRERFFLAINAADRKRLADAVRGPNG